MTAARDITGQLRVVAAAINVNGCIVSVPQPGRHGDVIRKLYESGILADGADERRVDLSEQGFLLSDGRFARRKPAWRIAEDAGQLLDRAPTDKRGGTLYSEDVW